MSRPNIGLPVLHQISPIQMTTANKDESIYAVNKKLLVNTSVARKLLQDCHSKHKYSKLKGFCYSHGLM